MNTKNPLISIILPVKNGSPTLLERAVNSVLSQTLADFELLLVDDGSTAEFAKELDRIAAADERIKLFHRENQGVSAARNFAIDQASGGIITFLDGDDMIDPCCFEEAARLLDDMGTDGLWGGTFYGDEETIACKMKEGKGATGRSAEELTGLTLRLVPERLHDSRAECIGEPFRFENDGYINRGIAARFIKKQAILDGGLFFHEDLRILEDAVWNLEMLDKLNIAYVKTVWYYYLENESSVSNAFNIDILENMETPLGRIKEILDMTNGVEYAAYTRLLMDSLRYVHKCLYGNPMWKAERTERKKLASHLYNDEPWSEIGTARYSESAAPGDKKKATLYRQRLLLKYWDLTRKRM